MKLRLTLIMGGFKGKQKHSKNSERIIEVVSVKIENNSNSITSPTTNGRQEKESDETAPE